MTTPAIVTFWREAGPGKWFEKDERFDTTCRDSFLDQHLAIAARRHDDWMATAEGALGLILLTDQIPGNVFRGTAHIYATVVSAALSWREQARHPRL